MGNVRQLLSNRSKEIIGLILFAVTFESVLALVAKRGSIPQVIEPWTLAALGFASFRAGRAIAFNDIFSWLRLPFTETNPDSSGAGLSSEPKGEGFRKVIGELLCCPICAGTWAALIFFALLVFYPPLGIVTIYVLAAAGIAEYLHWGSERAEWQGRAAREDAGTAWLLKNRNQDFRQTPIILVRENPLTPEEREELFAQGWREPFIQESVRQNAGPYSSERR